MKTRKKNNKQDIKVESVVYYWYHHMAVDWKTADRINRAIQEHDWMRFQQALTYFGTKFLYATNKNGDLEKATCRFGCEFPDVIFVNYNDQEAAEKAGLVDRIPLNERTFQFITHSECECG